MSERAQLQRKCACGGKCADCKKNQSSLQRRAVDGRARGSVPSIVHDVLRSSGQPLDAATRAFFEPRLHHDFSRVKVHSDALAAQSAAAIGARAYAVGRDVVFGAGLYRPGSRSGRTLLAHELTHVVQQANSSPSVQTDLVIGSPGDPAEREADRVADATASDAAIPAIVSAGAGIQRDANTCTYGEISEWAVTSVSNFAPPAGLGDAKASIAAACTPARCNCVDGSTATAPGNQHAWSNIVAASGRDRTGGGTLMCVGTEQCGFVHQCTRCVNGHPTTVERDHNLVATGTATVAGKGTLYFYSDPLQSWCNATDRRTACKAPPPKHN